jgi:cytochrome P450
MSLKVSRPPGPKLPKLVQTALVFLVPGRAQRRWSDRYGSVIAIRVFPLGEAVYLTDPADIKAVFAADTSVVHAGEANSLLTPTVGASSVMVLDEQPHRERRRALLPPFHRDAVHAQAEQMAEIAARHVASWPVGVEFPVLPKMAEITLEVILRIIIGAEQPDRLEPLRAALSDLTQTGPLETLAFLRPELIRHRPWRGFRRRLAAADELLYAQIARRRADQNLEARTDVLAALVRESGLSDQELRDQVISLLLAGHETTATGLAWALERLTRHPELLARAVRAADEDDEEYLDALVKETLRVRSVVPSVARVLTEPFELSGYRIPAGVTVAPAILAVHRSAQLYPDPDRFDPDRMLGVNPSPTTWLPFGGGARRCLGAMFAQVEMRVVLREVLRRVRLVTTEAPAERVRVKQVTLVPAGGGRVRILARQG